jgi:hypothetical protein
MNELKSNEAYILKGKKDNSISIDVNANTFIIEK